MSEDLKYLNDENFQQTIDEGVTLVDFFAEWCGPCKMMSPIIEQLATELKGSAQIAKLDIEQAEKTTAEFGVTSIPTLIIYKNGKEVKRLVGMKDKATLVAAISSAQSA